MAAPPPTAFLPRPAAFGRQIVNRCDAVLHLIGRGQGAAAFGWVPCRPAEPASKAAELVCQPQLLPAQAGKTASQPSGAAWAPPPRQRRHGGLTLSACSHAIQPTASANRHQNLASQAPATMPSAANAWWRTCLFSWEAAAAHCPPARSCAAAGAWTRRHASRCCRCCRLLLGSAALRCWLKRSSHQSSAFVSVIGDSRNGVGFASWCRMWGLWA